MSYGIQNFKTSDIHIYAFQTFQKSLGNRDMWHYAVLNVQNFDYGVCFMHLMVACNQAKIMIDCVSFIENIIIHCL